MPCSVEGCGARIRAKGLCNRHYIQKRLKGAPDPAIGRPDDWGRREKHPLYRTWNGMMRYHADNVAPGWNDFWSFVAGCPADRAPNSHLARVNDDEPWGPDNVYWHQRSGDFTGEKRKVSAREASKVWRERHASYDYYRNASLKRNHGITLEQFNEMLEAQGGVCAICGKKETKLDPRTGKVCPLCVDHCHTGGHNRGLLCFECNVGLGKFRDDIDLLLKAAMYLEHHRRMSPTENEVAA